ncbi:MAG: metalloregulator ArsR/SmtB family transcription factor [bacterium]|nr:metalloregulator ArsR/SmtB family transcription factor [bacterium]
MKLSKKDCAKISAFAKIFANPIRVDLLCLLKDGELNVTAICKEVNSKESNISQQLRYLWVSGYISKKRKGREIYYCLKNQKALNVLKRLKDLSK